MKKTNLLIMLTLIMLIINVNGLTYTHGTITGLQESYAVTGFGDFGSGIPFQLNETGIIESVTIFAQACFSNSGSFGTAPDSLPLKFTIRNILSSPSNESTEDLTNIIAGNCSSFVSGTNTFNFDTPLLVNGSETYYLVISPIQWNPSGTYYTDLALSTIGTGKTFSVYNRNTIWNLTGGGWNNDPFFNLTYTGINPPVITLNNTADIRTESFTIEAGVNEVSQISYSYSDNNGEIFSTTFDQNDSSVQIQIFNLEANTDYTWQVNFTSELDGENTVIRNSLTTNQYVLTGFVRSILNLLLFILFSISIGTIILSEMDTANKGKAIIFLIIVGLLLLAFVNAILTS